MPRTCPYCHLVSNTRASHAAHLLEQHPFQQARMIANNTNALMSAMTEHPYLQSVYNSGCFHGDWDISTNTGATYVRISGQNYQLVPATAPDNTRYTVVYTPDHKHPTNADQGIPEVIPPFPEPMDISPNPSPVNFQPQTPPPQYPSVPLSFSTRLRRLPTDTLPTRIPVSYPVLPPHDIDTHDVLSPSTPSPFHSISDSLDFSPLPYVCYCGDEHCSDQSSAHYREYINDGWD
jgi:hypothetical protein